MKIILAGLHVLIGLLSFNSYSFTFTQKNISLSHPANGDILQLDSGYLAVSGHSATDRWLSLISLDDFSVRSITIPPDAQFFHKIRLSGEAGEQLGFLTTAGLRVYSIANGQSRMLLKSPSMFPIVDNKRLGHLEIVFDITHSGRDDFLIPDFNAYHLWLQQSDGAFVHYRLAIKAKAEMHEDGPHYAARKPYLIDTNLDGKTDIVFVQDGQLLSFVQRADGSFSESSISLTPGMAISLDSESGIRAGDGRNFNGLVINNVHELTDLDGDGLTDIIIRREVFASSLDQNYDYRIHYGRSGNAGLRFDKEPDTKINTRGVQFESVFADINGDGRKDFYTPTARFGLGTIVRALISGSASLEIQFYLMDGNRAFSHHPDHRHKATANISISRGSVDLPIFQVASTGGDAQKHLLIGENQTQLRLHLQGEKQLFATQSFRFNMPLPRDGAKVRALDLNGDGKEDLVLPFSSQDEEETRNQLRLLITQ